MRSEALARICGCVLEANILAQIRTVLMTSLVIAGTGSLFSLCLVKTHVC